MELSKLKTFTVVAKTLHFGKAADELGLTQPAVSHQIRSLEQQFGENLFSRTGKKVRLTMTGRQVLDLATDVLHRIELMKRQVSANRESRKRTLRLVGNVRSLEAPFPQLLQAWRDKNSDLDLVFNSSNRYESNFDAIRAGFADCGFTTNPDSSDDLVSIPWGRLEVSLLVAGDHELAGVERLDAEMLQEARWINFDKGWWSRRLFDENCLELQIRPDRTYETEDGSIVHGLVKEGSGVAILPRWGGIRDELETGELVSIEPHYFGLDVMVFLTFRKGDESEKTKRFLDFMLVTPLDGIPLITN